MYELNNEEVLRKRKERFSKFGKEAIINDPLRDVALLSRSGESNTIIDLKINHDKRSEMVSMLKLLFYDEKQLTTVEHGLRKLREVFMSIRQDHTDEDESFWKQASEVYKLSYDFLLRHGQYNKLGGLVLNAIHEWFPLQYRKPYAKIYALYLSHIEKDVPKCVDFLQYSSVSQSESLDIINMANIYVLKSESPRIWFHYCKNLKDDEFNFLEISSVMQVMINRTENLLQLCYNQLSVKVAQQLWFGDHFTSNLETRIKDKYDMRAGTDIILFKKRQIKG